MLQIPIESVLTLKFFSSLDPSLCQEILDHAEEVILESGEVLFRQNAISDSLYVVLSGRLLATVVDAEGSHKVVGTITPGDPLGELGAISGEPRTLTITALEKSALIKITSDFFKTLCQKNASLLFGMIQTLITRSQNTLKIVSGEETFVKQIVIIPANNAVPFQPFIERLKKHLSDTSQAVMATESGLENRSEEQIYSFTCEVQGGKERTIFYFLTPHETLLSKNYLEKTDMVYIVGEGNRPPQFSDFILEVMKKNKTFFKRRCELILIQPENIETPANTQRWLEGNYFDLHHHVHINSDKDILRLIRFLRGKAISLVLGGGGAKGWTHVGVLKALIEANIPIDAVGGASIGALAAAAYLLKQNYETAAHAFHTVVGTQILSLRHLTWPVASIFDCKLHTENIQEVFSALRIEDLWLPYYCVSYNFSLKQEEIHRQGLVWEKIRASASIPAVVPPMIINGEIHFDGGLIDNLPVDTMKKILGNSSTVIAVRLSTDHLSGEHYNFPPILTFKNVLLTKLRLIHPEYKFPRFFDTFFNALLAGSLPRERQNAAQADLLINPDLNSFTTLALSKEQKEQLIEIGYQTTLKKLATSKFST